MAKILAPKRESNVLDLGEGVDVGFSEGVKFVVVNAKLH